MQSLQKEAKQLVYYTYSMTKVGRGVAITAKPIGAHPTSGCPFAVSSMVSDGLEKRRRPGQGVGKGWPKTRHFAGRFGVNISATGWVRCLILVVKTL